MELKELLMDICKLCVPVENLCVLSGKNIIIKPQRAQRKSQIALTNWLKMELKELLMDICKLCVPSETFVFLVVKI